jgi:hypothetical protein
MFNKKAYRHISACIYKKGFLSVYTDKLPPADYNRRAAVSISILLGSTCFDQDAGTVSLPSASSFVSSAIFCIFSFLMVKSVRSLILTA